MLPGRRHSTFRFLLFFFLAVEASGPRVHAEPASPASTRILSAGIDGSLVLSGGSKPTPAIQARFVELAGGKSARLVIVPTASPMPEGRDEFFLTPWKDCGAADVTLLHVKSRELADDRPFCDRIRQATGIWFTGGDQSQIADVCIGTMVEQELHALLKRGGAVGGTSAGATVMSRVMIAGENPELHVATGFDMLPGAVIDTHVIRRKRIPRLFKVLESHPGLFGCAVGEDTALVIRGREMRVVGDATVTLLLSATKARPAKEVELKSGDVVDLTAWRRAAVARTQPAFPPDEVPEPVVPNGALVIVGGGGMPKEVTEKFIELAGGPDSLIVTLPTANPDPLPERTGDVGFFERAGAKNVKALRGRTPAEVESPEFLATLKEARGVWFGGGRQWRFVDAYAGTKAEEAFHDVLRRGGVIGGSSAGATIQAYYLSRGSPLGNTEMMTEGYERGLSFLPGTAIDQHFAQRKRFTDMTLLMTAHPQLLGIGIDETTAVIVRGSTAEVLGKNAAHFYDRRKPVADGQPDYETVKPGGKYDLKERVVLR